MKFIFKTWKQFVCGCFIFATIFALLSLACIQQLQRQDTRQFNTHAEIITNDLWALSKSGAQSYLQLAVQVDHYKYLAVYLEGGAPFIKVNSHP
jgi:hypothetical protein